MTNKQRCILFYCKRKPRTFREVQKKFHIPEDCYQFNVSVFGENGKLNDLYDVRTAVNFYDFTMQANSQGIEALENHARWHFAIWIPAIASLLAALISLFTSGSQPPAE